MNSKQLITVPSQHGDFNMGIFLSKMCAADFFSYYDSN